MIAKHSDTRHSRAGSLRAGIRLALLRGRAPCRRTIEGTSARRPGSRSARKAPPTTIGLRSLSTVTALASPCRGPPFAISSRQRRRPSTPASFATAGLFRREPARLPEPATITLPAESIVPLWISPRGALRIHSTAPLSAANLATSPIDGRVRPIPKPRVKNCIELVSTTSPLAATAREVGSPNSPG